MPNINFGTLAKRVDDTIEYIYPRTDASIVKYTDDLTVQEKLDSLQQSIDSLPVGGGGTGGSVTVDSSLSSTSVNPVQNKVINTALGTKLNKSGFTANMNLVTDASGNIVTAAMPSGGGATAEQIQQIETNKNDIVEINKKIEDILYKAIEISSFTNNRGTVEKGSTITSVVLSWTLNKNPETLTLDGSPLTVTDRSKSLTGLSITANKTYTLKAVDARDAEATRSTSISFVNGVYYGSAAIPSTIDSAFILGLTKKLQGSRGMTINSFACGTNQYCWYAVPTSYGTCKFNVGGFDGGVNKVHTFQFTNASGYTESYDVYRSDNHSIGTQKFVIS